ncbi:AGR205Cp [Eremothecium gossypii ATCC 10895]|uniref:tRNA-splicing endonuclease subunit SEN54 n=1 Tax=Eremothecium gossypii (strain ATCC 10895 / CBS 109.51 / FGSC 9923 / NRRL Y-1056) TaxID=284811 RepID=SEN54_EREGS|nr:AGR205Cp [Eremothecium gossypii ATCC 10895]Q74ZJ5.1 RecName: Full=tRNA-splicing endonuclease subunit SEN54; AltName: Full=tRNA-intron endonuclease SEN54 [Eremothecium gossypii ATCC 10895]AAS54695.1 AGR205Cp [Eremothecium gossypii ATCC 10895]
MTEAEELSVALGLHDSDAEEDALAQDWSEMAKLVKKANQHALPRRGEKDYEPDGTDAQALLLHTAKETMFGTLLNSVRGSTVKTLIKAYWEEEQRMARIPNARGSFTNTMGKVDKHGQCWLQLHEFVYLVERGTVSPYLALTVGDEKSNHEDVLLSVQDVYALFSSTEELDEFLVYAHLKRLGFIVVSTDNPPAHVTSFYPPLSQKSSASSNWFCHIHSWLKTPQNLFHVPLYHPLHFLLHRYTSSPQLYEELSQHIPFKKVPHDINELREERNNGILNPNVKQWKIAFNVWKPKSSFKKKTPGLPDFQVVVYNKDNAGQQFPTYDEFRSIFHRLDYRFDFLNELDVDDSAWDDYTYTDGMPTREFMQRNKIAPSQPHSGGDSRKKKARTYPQHIAQIRRLKSGFKSFILSVIDDGLVSFVRIAESDFGSSNIWYTPPSQTGTTNNRTRSDKVDV